MHVHLTCSRPTRSLVVTMHAARQLLLSAGHRVSLSWPEAWADEESRPRVRIAGGVLALAQVIVHLGDASERRIPEELAEAARAGKVVIALRPSSPGVAMTAATADSPIAVSRLEDLLPALHGGALASVGGLA